MAHFCWPLSRMLSPPLYANSQYASGCLALSLPFFPHLQAAKSQSPDKHSLRCREMEKQEPQQQQPNTNTKTNTEDSLRKRKKPLGISDRLKRDEWSEGAVSNLLDVYEAKWVLRNRAKLKGQDWEDVARHVSSRVQWSKAPKTQTQCKNKIESMKKRYRTESTAGGDPSSWPLFRRLDLLLRCGAPAPQQTLPLVGVAQQQLQQEEEEELPLVNGGGELQQQQQLQLQAWSAN